MKYKKKPIKIEAIQWTGDLESFGELVNFANVTQYSQITTAQDMIDDTNESNCIYIHTLEGEMRASVGDYIIKGIQGEFYPCKPDIFEQTYELVE